jgi:hypothetical protein
MQKLLLSAAGAVLASSMIITPAQAFWGSWGDGPWYGGPWHGGPWYGGYPYYGGWGGYPGYGWGGYPGYGWGGYPGYGGYGWGHPWGYGYAPYAAPQVTTPSSSGAEK